MRAKHKSAYHRRSCTRRQIKTASVALTTVPRANIRFEMCGVG
ncbi:hypothetical protein [Streptomyces griseofuscus]